MPFPSPNSGRQATHRLRLELLVVVLVKCLVLATIGLTLFGSAQRIHVDKHLLTERLFAPLSRNTD